MCATLSSFGMDGGDGEEVELLDGDEVDDTEQDHVDGDLVDENEEGGFDLDDLDDAWGEWTTGNGVA